MVAVITAQAKVVEGAACPRSTPAMHPGTFNTRPASPSSVPAREAGQKKERKKQSPYKYKYTKSHTPTSRDLPEKEKEKASPIQVQVVRGSHGPSRPQRPVK